MRLAQALERAERRDESLCLLFVDLDGFKKVNDRSGHEVGDALIAAVAGRIEGCLRPPDTAARVGGDEFCVLLEKTSGYEEGVRVAERLVVALQAPFSLDDSTVRMGASIGISVKAPTDGGRSPDDLVRQADAAMYRAKNRTERSVAWSS